MTVDLRGAAYAASRISSTLKGSTKQFGWLQASATKNYSAPMSSDYAATIRIDKDEGRTACMGNQGTSRRLCISIDRSDRTLGSCRVDFLGTQRSLSDMELSPNEDLYAVRTP